MTDENHPLPDVGFVVRVFTTPEVGPIEPGIGVLVRGNKSGEMIALLKVDEAVELIRRISEHLGFVMAEARAKSVAKAAGQAEPSSAAPATTTQFH